MLVKYMWLDEAQRRGINQLLFMYLTLVQSNAKTRATRQTLYYHGKGANKPFCDLEFRKKKSVIQSP